VDGTAENMPLDKCQALLTSVDQNEIPFMQLFNLYQRGEHTEAIQKVATCKSLARIAADLLGVDAIRLYQDAVFIKRPGDGETRWHSDLNTSPFDTNDFVTCWIPLQNIPAQEDGGTGLSFASGSHKDFALPYWSDVDATDLSDRYVVDSYDSYTLGDCSFHHGWTLHSAPGNPSGDTRYAYAVSFVADGARLLNAEGHIRYPDNEDSASYAGWINDIGWGGIAEHPLTPLVFWRDGTNDSEQNDREE